MSTLEEMRTPEGVQHISEDAAGQPVDEAASLPLNETAAPAPKPIRLGRRDWDRTQELDAAIVSYPESAVNYMLRGELFLKAGELGAAERDFEIALQLSEADYRASGFGLAAQVIRDRALTGLRDIRGQ
ncbi:MAG: hypothetical protein KME04_16960 [Pleurocapsa minor GSE-CHR-MK-17-07R]|nr:hypothetical protein [Pleurocapsa minor GSE-CHR-MK 17-07R]